MRHWARMALWATTVTVSSGHGPMGHEDDLERLELRDRFVQGVGRPPVLGPSLTVGSLSPSSDTSVMGSLGCHTVSHRTRALQRELGFLHPLLVVPVGKLRPEQHGGLDGQL